METLKLIDIGIRFLLELCILVIFGYWGFKTGNNTLMKFLLGVGALYGLEYAVIQALDTLYRLPTAILPCHGNSY